MWCNIDVIFAIVIFAIWSQQFILDHYTVPWFFCFENLSWEKKCQHQFSFLAINCAWVLGDLENHRITLEKFMANFSFGTA